MIDDFETTKVTVNKALLLEALRKNRSAHRKELVLATAEYRKQSRAQAEAMLAEIDAGKPVRDSTGLKAPTSHVKDYDVVIEMLEWSTAQEITISQTQFRQFVRDEWDWMRVFKNETSRYLG